MKDFTSQKQKRMLETLLSIPSGYVTTYKALACHMGINSTQAIGQLLKRNPYPDIYPCYKVVKSDGTLGGFSGTLHSPEKKRRLATDGITIKDNRIINFKTHLFDFSNIE